MSRGWVKASVCRLQITLSCAVLCHIVLLQYLSRSSIHRLAGLPCRLFLSYGLKVVASEVHRSSFMRLMCAAQDHFIFLTLLINSMTFMLSLTQVLVLLILYGMSIILPAGVVHLSLQTDGNVAFDDIPVSRIEFTLKSSVYWPIIGRGTRT